jgi:hypothetical protein
MPAQVAMPHDWRLPIPMLEDRDAWFTRTKTEIEMQVIKSGGTKAVLISHSYGATVTFAFLTWVEEQQAGWVDKHLEAWANLAGPILGLPKALAPLFSGEGSLSEVAHDPFPFLPLLPPPQPCCWFPPACPHLGQAAAGGDMLCSILGFHSTQASCWHLEAFGRLQSVVQLQAVGHL